MSHRITDSNSDSLRPMGQFLGTNGGKIGTRSTTTKILGCAFKSLIPSLVKNTATTAIMHVISTRGSLCYKRAGPKLERAPKLVVLVLKIKSFLDRQLKAGVIHVSAAISLSIDGDDATVSRHSLVDRTVFHCRIVLPPRTVNAAAGKCKNVHFSRFDLFSLARLDHCANLSKDQSAFNPS